MTGSVVLCFVDLARSSLPNVGCRSELVRVCLRPVLPENGDLAFLDDPGGVWELLLGIVGVAPRRLRSRHSRSRVDLPTQGGGDRVFQLQVPPRHAEQVGGDLRHGLTGTAQRSECFPGSWIVLAGEGPARVVAAGHAGGRVQVPRGSGGDGEAELLAVQELDRCSEQHIGVRGQTWHGPSADHVNEEYRMGRPFRGHTEI